MTTRNRREIIIKDHTVIRLWAPVFVYMALIYLLSSNSFDFLFFKKIQKNHGDWLVHVVEYTTLGFLLARATGNYAVFCRRRAFWFVSVILMGTLYGVSDEIHQSFVPNRDASAYDVAADGVGVLAGFVLWIFYKKSKKGVSKYA